MSQFSKYDSEFCGTIPIHIINTTQEYGVLLVLDRHSLIIEQVGENAGAMFQLPYKTLPGTPVHDVIGALAFRVLQEHLEKGNGKYATTWEINGQRHYTLLHVKENMVIVEIETHPTEDTETSFTTLYQSLRTTIQKVESAPDIQQVCTIAAEELKRISGFDKVMIYAFDYEWNGNVLAEAMEPGMESYLGFTFPASDIPKPARDMYQKNPYRFIPNREFKPVKLYPVINPITNTFLDMTECNLRGVAAVHVEYLKNMHVMASMSVRLLKDGALWGLIACHHKTSRHIDNQLCTVLEFLSTIISARINVLHHQKFLDLSARLNGLYTQLIENIYQSKNLVKGLLHEKPSVMELFEAQGVVVTYKNKIEKAGEVPNASQLEDLVLWLHLKQLRKVFHTDSLSGVYDMAMDYQETASGLLVIPIQSAQDEYLILFRKEYIRTTSWGGNPEERIFFDKDPKVYHPRHSFKLWQEHMQGFSKPWLPEEVMAAENLRSFIYELINPEPLAYQQ
ncbi:GAF domain-containing protein [Longitalea arenae]|uniref:GAF domain-containing protein n=1 Tax=Longitalea arenae TaxID=2812558 RepID=UPI0019688B5C|nr:GAF domain-containing protein [Longitalea arenae]